MRPRIYRSFQTWNGKTGAEWFVCAFGFDATNLPDAFGIRINQDLAASCGEYEVKPKSIIDYSRSTLVTNLVTVSKLNSDGSVTSIDLEIDIQREES